MKSNIFKTMAVAVTAIFAGYNVYLAQAKTNAISADILMTNVEALAQSEGGAMITCSKRCDDGIGQCWTYDENNSTPTHKYCRWDGSTYVFCICGQ